MKEFKINGIFLFWIFLGIIHFNLFGAPLAPFEPYDYEFPAGELDKNGCFVGNQYNPNLTRITFYGDSRLDYADAYGYNMLYYINDGVDGAPGRSAPNFGIQNFGHAAWISWHLNDHLSNCLPNSDREIH